MGLLFWVILVVVVFLYGALTANIPQKENVKLAEELTNHGIELLKRAGNDVKDSDLPFYIQEYGVRGLNYDIDAKKRPYIHCDEFNLEKCAGRPMAECTKTVKCYPSQKSHKLACMAVFIYNATSTFDNNTLHESTPTLKGCWNQDESELQECRSESECAVESRRTHMKDRVAKFCCCRTHNCNQNLTLYFTLPGESSDSTIPTPLEADILWIPGFLFAREVFYFITVVLVCICVFLVVLMYYWVRKNQREKEKKLDGKFAGDGLFNPSKHCHSNFALLGNRNADLNQIVLLERTSNGRFGEVYKAQLDKLLLAVKIFPQSDSDSWTNEQDIYAIRALRSHENIVDFVAAIDHDKKLWLVTIFHEKGSLYDYLKSHTLTLREAIVMVSGMLNGLAFLHEEKVTEPNDKPTIVHRDFKSKNVLVKNDLTTCIADFGLALKCANGRMSPDENHGQVGTRRYMSPEILEGATEFSAFAFQQIDVYAAALVLWEILSRTNVPDVTEELNIQPYKLPYEQEVGPAPSLGHMRELVVIRKFRPLIRDALYHNKITDQMVKTMIEMWDMEPDGRITSGCARDRMFRLREAMLSEESVRNNPTPDEHVTGETTPLLRRKETQP